MELTLSKRVVTGMGRDQDIAYGRDLLHRLDPKRFEGLGVYHTERVVVRAVDYCDHHQLRMFHHLAYVLFVMVHLGSFFDEDPRFASLGDIFADVPVAGDSEEAAGIDHRLARARDAFIAIGERYIGPEGHLRAQAAQRFADQLATLDDDNASLDEVRNALASLYPCGAQAVPLSLLERAEPMAAELGLVMPVGAKLSLVLLFWLGAGVAKDPLYPWVRDLAPQPGEDPAAGTSRLVSYSRKRFLQRMRAMSESDVAAEALQPTSVTDG